MNAPRPGHRRGIDDELRHHIRESTELLVAQGWDPDDALREARRRFGDPSAVRRELEEIERKGAAWRGFVELARAIASDARYALRSLALNPGFTFAVVATLGLGAGVATSIFSVVDAVVLRPLAYAEAERLVEVSTRRGDRSFLGQSTARYEGWREAGSEFADAWLGYFRETRVRTDGAAGEPLSVLAVTPEAGDLLGMPLLLGRGFAASDARPGAAHVAVLSREYYERMGGDTGVLGSTMMLETGPVTVVGVLRGDIKFPDYARPPDLWLPIQEDLRFAGRDLPGFQGVWARLHPGLSLEEAQARADVIADRLQEATPLDAGWMIGLTPVGSRRGTADARRALWILAATVGLILVIAVVNGVNLLLVRATGRAREFAIRIAVGGSRLRLARQLLVEGLVLGLMGGAMAALLAWAAVQGLGGMLPSSMAFFAPHAVAIESRTLAFAFATGLLAGMTLGFVPGLGLVRSRPALSGSRGSDEPPGRRRFRRLLVMGQVALSTVLLVGAGLFVRSLASLARVDPGFDVRRIATATIELPESRYGRAERTDLLRRIEARLEADPLVAGFTFSTGTAFSFGATLEPQSGDVPEGQPGIVPYTSVAPDYVETVGMELVAGRGFDVSDAGRDVAIVDRDLAVFLWGASQVVGRRFRMGEERPWLEVVGVVRELRLMGRDQREGPHQILFPVGEEGPASYLVLVARTAGDPAAVLPHLRRAVGEADPTAPIHRLRTGAQLLADEEQQLRFLMTVMGLLGAVAVGLASVGLYGVLAYSVRRRGHELGVRMALGADARRVLAMVLLDGLVMASVGIGLGLAGAFLAADVAESLLYEMAPRDPQTFLSTAILFLAIAGAASLFPALRATSIDPATSLRAE